MDDLLDLEIEKIDLIIKKITDDPEEMDIKRTELELWEKIRRKSLGGRRTGLGITAEGDMLAALGMRYGSDEANAALDCKCTENPCCRSLQMLRRNGQRKGRLPYIRPPQGNEQPYDSPNQGSGRKTLRRHGKIRQAQRLDAYNRTLPALPA